MGCPALQSGRCAADTRSVVAYPHALARDPLVRVHWWRLPLAAAVIGAVAASDTLWKTAAIAAGHAGAGCDTPGTWVRPFGTMVFGLLSFAGVMLLPRLCVPGALLAAAGMGSNILSLALWQAVPNPFGMHLAGGILRFNMADLCVWGGCLLFLATASWTIARTPAERFAAL